MITEQGVPQPAAQGGLRPSGWQLAVIGAVVALAAGIGLVLGFTVLAPRANPLGGAASYVPDDSVMYFEARLDQSPAQAQAFRAVVQRFPAVKADKPLLETIGALIDKGMEGSGSPITFAADVDPWFDGRVGVAMLDYPLASVTAGEQTVPNMAVLLGVDDPAAAAAFSDKLRAAMQSEGSPMTSSQHAGVTIWSTDESAAGDGNGQAFAITDDQVLVSNRSATIATLVDTHAGSASFAARRELQQLAGHLPSDWTGFYAVDTAQISEQLKAALAKGDPSMAGILDPYLAGAPAFSAGTIGFANDALLMDAAQPAPSGDRAVANSRRDLAARVPGDALFFADGADLGHQLTAFVSAMRAALAAQADGAGTSEMLDQAEAGLGADLEDFVSWIGDGAVAAGITDGTPYGGLVLEAADVDAATRRFGQLKTLLQLAAQSGGEQLSISTDTVGGVEVTTVAVKTGMSTDAAPVPSRVVVQYAMKESTVLIGFGDQFVGRSLSIEEGASLADADRFIAAVDRFGGQDSLGITFLDLAGLRTAVEATAGSMLPSEYVQQVKPNLEPLDYLVSVTQVESDTVVSHAGIVLR